MNKFHRKNLCESILEILKMYEGFAYEVTIILQKKIEAQKFNFFLKNPSKIGISK